MTDVTAWRLDTPTQTLVLASFSVGVPEVVYWSAPLPEDEDIVHLAAATRPAASAAMLDAPASPSICPEPLRGYPGQPGLVWRTTDGRLQTARLALAEVRAGHDERGRHLTFALGAEGGPALTVTLVADDAAITASAHVAEFPADAVALDWHCPFAIALPTSIDTVTTLGGRWCGEFQPQEIALGRGTHREDSTPGRTSHESSPTVFASADEGAWGVHLAWSGGHTLMVETLPDGRRVLQIAPQFGPNGLRRNDLERMRTVGAPALVLVRADDANGVSQALHRVLRQSALAGLRHPRPVHYNCWEAVYFDHDPATLTDLASRAAALGVERFVLDDGWFGRRDSDDAALGDWTVDRRKWADGLTPFVDHVRALGMEFGLWVEPEMVNEDSDLFRAHPDWVLGSLDQPRGRRQLVLDLRRPEVADHLFARLDALLRETAISYLKWDHNRPLPFPDPAQALGTAALLARLAHAHPEVEIESCASGGGRIDFAILRSAARVWPSDSNDALERLRIQRGAGALIPPEVTGSHVGPRVCHTSARVLPMRLRAGVAGTRAMGVEMDLRELTDDEAATLRTFIDRFKARRHILHRGRLYRLDHPDPEILAELHLSEDGAEFVVFAAQMGASAQPYMKPLRLAGLDPHARYEVRLEDAEHVSGVLNHGPRNPLVRGEMCAHTGTALMHLGLQLPNSFPQTLWTVNGRRQ